MNKIDLLIQRLCPNGVNYEELSDICELKRGQSITLDSLNVGVYPVVAGGQKPSFYCDIYNRDKDTVVVAGSGAYAGYISYWSTPILVTDAFSVRAKGRTINKFIYYFLKNKQELIHSLKKGGGVPHVYTSTIENFRVPVPPLEVQHEIVRILDNFIELIAKLTDELTARKQQYNYYLNKLLNSNEMNFLTIQDISTKVIDGSHNPPSQSEIEPLYPMLSAKNINNGILDFNDARMITYFDFIKEHKRTQVNKGDVLLTIVGAIGRVAVIENDIDVVFQRSVCIIGLNNNLIISKYLKYALETQSIQKYIHEQANGAAQKGIYLNQIKKIRIPVPSLDEQQRIVDILDKFDKLVNDISEGLPAEIAARQKQYEYYRDKLLTFKEVGNESI